MSYTANDIINMTLRSLGVLAEGETPSADTSADALMAMNMMIDSWSTEKLATFTTTDQSFTWPANQATRTLGPTGQLVGVRPVLLSDATYYIVDGISYQIQIINQQQYTDITLKTTTSTLPQYLYSNADFPDTTITLYPVPTQALTFHFISAEVLSEPAALATTLSFPPGYARAFWSNLAREIAAQFGVGCPKSILSVANVSKANIQKINNPMDVMSVPNSLMGYRYGGNVYTGWM